MSRSINCTICTNHRVHQMDAAINHGRSLRGIGLQFEVSYDALRRHRANGHVAPPTSVVSRPVAEAEMTDAEWFAQGAALFGVDADEIRAHYEAGHHLAVAE